jgi:hypothetical protein
MQVHPCRRRHRRHRPCSRFRRSISRKHACRARHQGSSRIGWPGKNRNGNQPEDATPVLPLADLHEIVRSHQPDETILRKACPQESERVGRVRRAEPPLDVGDANARMPGDSCRRLQPFLQRRRVARVLQRVLRRQHPPDLVEAQPLQRQHGDVAMSLVRRVERAAEEPDPAPPKVKSGHRSSREVKLAAAHARKETRRRRRDRGRLHGRHWPEPRTTYLKLVSCSAPTGPRACSLPVAIPISAPMPNSPPSAN